MADRVQVTIQALGAFTEKSVKALTLEVTANLIESTPVETGWARANWVPQIGSPYESTDGSRSEVSASAQQSGIAAVATGYKITRGPVWVSNNVPYIGALNNGHSRQAPAAFIQAAILRALRTVHP